jgi:hypothetical protein
MRNVSSDELNTYLGKLSDEEYLALLEYARMLRKIAPYAKVICA